MRFGKLIVALLLAILLSVGTTPASSQGIITGTVSGTVEDSKQLVIRGGYSINIAPAFYTIFLNSYSSAPVLVSATVNCGGVCVPTGGSTYTTVHAQDTKYIPTGGNPGSFNQTLVPTDFRQPYTQTFELGTQYQLDESLRWKLAMLERIRLATSRA